MGGERHERGAAPIGAMRPIDSQKPAPETRAASDTTWVTTPRGTGYDVILWINEAIEKRAPDPPPP